MKEKEIEKLLNYMKIHLDLIDKSLKEIRKLMKK